VVESLEQVRTEFRSWLSGVGVPARADDRDSGGPFSVAVFDDLTPEQESEAVRAGRAWEQQKFDAGWGALDWPTEFGGRALPHSYAAAIRAEEDGYQLPRRNELFAVTQQMIAPTIRQWGDEQQVRRFVRALLRTDLMACQLFSEPEAGSDLAAVRTRAARDGDSWVLTGQKVWSSMATAAEWGEAICRTDSQAAKHAGLTVFMVPMDAPGVTIRPIRQMTGGASFNEVFLDDVRIPDSLRIGPVGSGWKVALSTLAAERGDSRSLGAGTVAKVVALARRLEVRDPVLIDQVVDLWIHDRVQQLNNERSLADLLAGQEPGAQGSIGKLAATINMRRTSDVVTELLGRSVAADTGEWATFAWTEQVLGAPGYRIAGGSDEIQRNIIAERVLGLPRG
jgi:alkylation response protein AidB-like acyl-CoA dehydrogenase